jgi:hypothetical protein
MIMKNEEEENQPKVSVSEHYDPENPQKQNVPQYNSTTEHRDAGDLPAIENLNHKDGLKDELKETKKDDSDTNVTDNTTSLFGKDTKTDLGAGQRDDDEAEDEKIIRT